VILIYYIAILGSCEHDLHLPAFTYTYLDYSDLL